MRVHLKPHFWQCVRWYQSLRSSTRHLRHKILQACQQIGHGQTDTYKNLAVQVGRDKAYRAVGNIMSNNRTPLIIPCHRVLGSTGKLCGFAGGLLMKRSLLELEAQK